MESNGFEIGMAAFGVASGLEDALVLLVFVRLLAFVVTHVGSLRLESI